jgi:RNA polymerase sigma-70 factor (ECF subfamily)
VENALAGLGKDQREVLDLRIIKGYTVAETARLLGKTEAAVRTSQYRALQVLARLLDDND